VLGADHGFLIHLRNFAHLALTGILVVQRHSSLTPAERKLRAEIAAEESWAQTEDRPARTAPARMAFLDKFEKQVDPDNQLSPAERAKRAEHTRRAHFKRMALKSVRARRRGGNDDAA
jgi:hypothetical protein